MAATPIPFASKDNSSGRLASGISAVTLTIPLSSGNGANFPQPYTGTTTSLGTATALNCTGISATIGGSAQEGKWIWNKTDGSVARIITGGVGTNALTTTRLLGGTANVWGSGDTWCLDPFVATFAILSTSAYGVQSITTYEEALITARSTDTLTVATGGRGYNGTVANTFSADDYVYLFSTSPIVERFKDIVSVIAQQQDTDRTTLATAGTNITNLQTGAYDYVVSTGSSNAYVAATPALAAYAAGNYFEFQANHTNTGAATINVNSLGAKSIKKGDGATALAANDIISGQIVKLRYDGTNFQMLSPVGTPATNTHYYKLVAIGPTGSSTSGTGATDFSTTYTIPANTLIAGVGFRFKCFYSSDNTNQITFALKLGSTTIDSFNITPATSSAGGILEGVVMGNAAAGASVTVYGNVSSGMGNGGGARIGGSGANPGSAAVATNGTLVFKLTGTNATSGTTTISCVTIEQFSTTAFA